MKHASFLRGSCALLLAVTLVLTALPSTQRAQASDHADPVDPFQQKPLEAGITDLFVFPARDMVRGKKMPNEKKGEADKFVPVTQAEANRLVIIFCVRRALTTSPPYPGLDQFTYKIHADFHSATQASFKKDDPNLLRYGGTVHDPEGIDEDFTITVQYDNNAHLTKREVQIKEGGEWKTPKKVEEIKWHSGVHDDPFIFPMFFGSNVIALVVSIPLDCLPAGQQDFLFWGTSAQGGTQIDHVGRSQRTQLPRFDFLNTLHPKDHVREIIARRDNPGIARDAGRFFFMPLYAFRPYDVQPDVMFFTRRNETGYPNGRLLEDDVADLTCKQGDCQLYELSQSHARSASFPGGRPTKNDKEFLDTFPYLADPWPDSDIRKPPELTARTQMDLLLIASVAGLFILLPWVLFLWTGRRLWRISRELQALKQTPRPSPTPAPAPPAPPIPPTAPVPPAAANTGGSAS
jgi:hypothetical protein